MRGLYLHGWDAQVFHSSHAGNPNNVSWEAAAAWTETLLSFCLTSMRVHVPERSPSAFGAMHPQLMSNWEQWLCPRSRWVPPGINRTGLHGDEHLHIPVWVKTALTWVYIVRSPHLLLHLSELKAELNLTFIKLQTALYCKWGMLCLFCIITHLPACLQFSIECTLRCTSLAQCTFPEHSGWAEMPDCHAHVQDGVILCQPIKRIKTRDQGEDDSGHQGM